LFRDLTGTGAPVEYELAISYGRSTPLVDAFTAVIRSRANWVGPAANQPSRPNRVRRS
jgi:hypothetical protein